MNEYLKHEHAHADENAWSDERLFDEVAVVADLLSVPRTPEQRARLSRRMARAAFEQMERYADAHPEAVILEAS